MVFRVVYKDVVFGIRDDLNGTNDVKITGIQIFIQIRLLFALLFTIGYITILKAYSVYNDV